MPSTLQIGLAINPGITDVVAPSADELRQLGLSWVRFLLNKKIGGNDGVQNLDTGQNSELDRLLDRYKGMDVKVLALINHETLGMSPDQMRANWNDAIQRVADLAAKVATFYRNRIGALEVLNEPDNFDPGASFSRFTAENYGALLKETFKRVKAIAPNLPVISAGLISPNTNYLKALVASSGGALDGVGWHLYLHPVRGFPNPDWGKPVYGQEMEDTLREVRKFGGKPIWVTEVGTSLNEIGSETHAAEYLTRAVDLMRELGTDVIANVFWFTWKFPPSLEVGKDYGLVDQANNPRHAFAAFQQQVQAVAIMRRVPLPPTITAVSFTPTSLDADQVLNVSVTVRNDDEQPLMTQGPNPGFVYDEGDTFLSRNFREISGSVRVGVDFDARTGLDHPFRWGLGKFLAPGETTTVTGGIRLKNPQSKNFWAGLVREGIAWLQDRQGTQLVNVTTLAATPDLAALKQQVAQLQAQVNQLQQQVAAAGNERNRLNAVATQIRQIIQNAGM